MKSRLLKSIENLEIINTRNIHGPRGGCWVEMALNDGTFRLRGPDTHGRIPKWIQNRFVGRIIIKCGGTTNVWSGWIVSRPSDLVYNGAMHGPSQNKLHLYTDRLTGTTFSVVPGENVMVALEKKRAEFAAYKKKGGRVENMIT